MAYTQEQLLQRLQTLPQDIQDAIFSEETAKSIQRIGKENGLNIEKVGLLADEAGLLMLGFTRPNEFIPNLNRRLAIEKDKARNIAQEVNGRVFAKIRESLKKIHGGETQEKKDSKQQTHPVEQKEEAAPTMPRIIKPSFSSEEPAIEENLEKKIENKQAEEEKQVPVEQKDIAQERQNEKIFRSKPETTDRGYPEGRDPYRESIE